MTTTLEGRLVAALNAKPGQKADELAKTLGTDRSEINQLLYGRMRNRVRQDSGYRWRLLDGGQQPAQEGAEPEAEQFANTDLSRLARYYLACLGYDDTGISTFLTSKFGEPDYVELSELPLTSGALADSSAGRQLLSRKRTERGRYGLYLGYPTNVSLLRSKKSDWQGYMVEPVFLFPIEQEQGTGRLVIDLSFPMINQKPLRAFTNAEQDLIMNELVSLEQELGLGGEGEQPLIDELAMRLQAVRPEWPWKEDIVPGSLSGISNPIAGVTAPGIYNRAVIIMAEKSPFTRELEQELRDLARLTEHSYRNTALGRWLASTGDAAPEPATSLAGPLIEILPMNSEQRAAVSAALTHRVTIITGPPGTGKSQVVTNLLANAAWAGKRVLFASKNNKAVDVVETRVNALGPRPVLLRVGGQTYQARLAEYVLALTSATTSAADKADFEDAQQVHQRLVEEHDRLARRVVSLVELRNDVDRLERQSEDARRRLGPEKFASASEIDCDDLLAALADVTAALNRVDRRQAPFLERLLWSFSKRSRHTALSDATLASNERLMPIGTKLPRLADPEANLLSIQSAVSATSAVVADLTLAQSYRERLAELQMAPPLELIARDDAALMKRIAANSSQLWKLWLRLQPSRLSASERQRLGRYTATLKMVIEAGDTGELSKQAYGQYSRLLKDVSHLLPCWAVTSLSARGRIPFEAGAFDIVVFDEASQCDIASALPLLYRAKSVVIIGDPKQLSHISGLPRGQDQTMLDKFGLVESHPHWAYSYQSLFALGVTQVSGDDIVTLVDHHRSHADIIEFSNREFYEDRLRVATRYDHLKSPNRDQPGIRWIDVMGSASRPGSGGAVNRSEVAAVVECLADLVLTKGYRGSLGVVTPFRAQANAITEAIHSEDALANALAKHGFLIDTVHKFQGDERDVMLFSPVVADGFPIGALNFLRSNPNLFNVAITRARAQLLVVGDRGACLKSDVGYLSRFAAYAELLSSPEILTIDDTVDQLGPTYPLVAQPDLVSDWERLFYTAMFNAGLRPIPQYPVEKYLLDFMVIVGDRRLAIEVDGERYHRNWTGELCRRDQIRNQRLFELGYDVMRFWVYEVRDDLESCVHRVAAWQ